MGVINIMPWPLHPREITLVLIEEQTVWASEPMWINWRTGNFLQFFFLPMKQQSLVGQGLLSTEASRSQ